MTEKTIDELKDELDQLKKENLEREIALEKQKIEEAEALKNKEEEDKQREALREEVRAEILAEKAKENTGKPEKLSTGAGNHIEEFKEYHCDSANYDLETLGLKTDSNLLSGRTYEDAVRDLKKGVKKRGAWK